MPGRLHRAVFSEICKMLQLVNNFVLQYFWLIFVYLNFEQLESTPIWTKQPPKLLYAEERTNVTLAWDFDLKGESFIFVKWGLLKSDQSWDKSMVMQGKGSLQATVVPEYSSRVRWHPNATMELINVSVSDSGFYACSLDLNDGSLMKDSMQLNVYRLVDVNQTKMHTVAPIEGRNFTLEFDAVSNYQPTATWHKNGIEIHNPLFAAAISSVGIKDNNPVYRFTLFKSNVHRNDSGTYQGYAIFGTARYLVRNFTVLVKYPPGNSTEFVTSTRSTMLLAGSSPFLSCTADSYPSPMFEILNSLTSLSNSSSGIYILNNINIEQEGDYFCHTKNEVGDGAIRSISIQVGASPQGDLDNKRYFINAGDSFSLNCTIYAWPMPTIKWFKNGVLFPESSNMTINRTKISNIDISKADLDDTANMTCIAENMFGKTTVQQFIEVFWLVVVDVNTTSFANPTEGSNFSIHYDIKVNSLPKVVWMKDGLPISNAFNTTIKVIARTGNSTHYRFFLLKDVVAVGDSGFYKAIVTFGDLKFESKNYSLAVVKAKQKSEQLKADDELDGWLYLMIIAFVALILLIFAVFMGVHYGRRIRGTDLERTGGADTSGMGESVAVRSQSVSYKESKTVAFQQDDTEEIGQTNNGFHRDSIYRFTVNPMFANPDSDENQLGNHSESENKYLPVSKIVYLPTNMDYVVDEAAITFDDENSEGAESVATGEQQDVVAESVVTGEQQDVVAESVATGEQQGVVAESVATGEQQDVVAESVDMWDQQVPQVELPPGGEEHEETLELIDIDPGEEHFGIDEDEAELMEDGLDDQDTQGGQEVDPKEHEISQPVEQIVDISDDTTTDTLGKTWILPPIVNEKHKEDSAEIMAYVSDLFDFRTSDS